MKYLILSLCLFITISYSKAEEKKTEITAPLKESAKEEKEVVLDFAKFSFVTNKGTEIKVHDLTCGLLRKMGKGERFINGYTSSNKPIYAQKWHRESPVWGKEVPVIEGYIFGAFIVLEKFPEDEFVTVDMVDTPPHEYEIEGKKLKQIKQTFNLTKTKNYPLVTIFKNEVPQLMQLGTWKKEFFNNGKLIFSYTFELIKADEEELKLNAVYEDYVKEAQKSLPPPEIKK